MFVVIACNITENTYAVDCLISELAKNPSAIISLLAMIVTVVLFLWNVFVVRKNSAIEFNRRVKLDYYEITVIEAIKILVTSVSKINKTFVNLKSKYNNANPNELYETCQHYISELDESINIIEEDVVILVALSDFESGKNIEAAVEQFYDKCTNVFSKFSRSALSERQITQLSTRFANLKKCLISKTYKICKDITP